MKAVEWTAGCQLLSPVLDHQSSGHAFLVRLDVTRRIVFLCLRLFPIAVGADVRQLNLSVTALNEQVVEEEAAH